MMCANLPYCYLHVCTLLTGQMWAPRIGNPCPSTLKTWQLPGPWKDFTHKYSSSCNRKLHRSQPLALVNQRKGIPATRITEKEVDRHVLGLYKNSGSSSFVLLKYVCSPSCLWRAHVEKPNHYSLHGWIHQISICTRDLAEAENIWLFCCTELHKACANQFSAYTRNLWLYFCWLFFSESVCLHAIF